MRVLVYEYACGGGFAERALPARWVGEGWAMLSSVVEDLAALAEVQVVSSLDTRLTGRRLEATEVIEVCDSAAERELFARVSPQCDGVLVIAPEIDGVLHQRCRWVESAGGRLLGPSSHAVALASDKFTLNRLLGQHDVPVPEACLVSGEELPADFSYPAVLKPRFGAGSEDTVLIEDHEVPVPSLMGTPGRAVLEEYVRGQPMSVSFLVGRSSSVPLPPGLQRFGGEGHFEYQGGRLPLLGLDGITAVEVAGRAIDAVPGLQGYVGVDLVLPGRGELTAEAPDAVVIEINPRLTTSYVGLRALARGNVAGWMLDVLAGRKPKMGWEPGEVEFDPDGTVRRLR